MSLAGQGSAVALWSLEDSSLIVRAMIYSSRFLSPLLVVPLRVTRLPRGVLLAAVLIVAASVLGGCGEVCDRMCDAQADLMEKCFPTWESSWEEQSYSGREAFVERCYTVWGDAHGALESGSTEANEFEERCRVQFEIALADSDCESVLQIDP